MAIAEGVPRCAQVPRALRLKSEKKRRDKQEEWQALREREQKLQAEEEALSEATYETGRMKLQAPDR